MWRPFESNEQKIYRKMGYFSDQDGIHQRYSKEATKWKEHLEKTKEFILKSAAEKGKKKAAVLGSGWLLDLPLDKLSECFEEVWLFDIRHPIQVRHHISKLRNIKLVCMDISGYAAPVYHSMVSAKRNKIEISWDMLKPAYDYRLEDFDFVVSCNLLDQLDTIPIDFLLKHHQIKPEKIPFLRAAIQQNHLNRLPKSKSCIITDLEELKIDKQGQLINEKKVIHVDIQSTNPLETWIWEFDNHSTYSPDVRTWFKVVAFEL